MIVTLNNPEAALLSQRRSVLRWYCEVLVCPFSTPHLLVFLPGVLFGKEKAYGQGHDLIIHICTVMEAR